MKAPVASHSFTLTANGGLLRVLTTPCQLCAGFDPATQPAGSHLPFTAIWDTGATGSVITKHIVTVCQLVPTGMVQTHGVHGTQLSPTYLVNILLPNGVQFANVRVTEGILPGGAGGDVLVGMDIITAGDFSLTNAGGKTVFSFRVPSTARTDFVADFNAVQSRAPKRKPPSKPQPKRPGKQFGRRK